MTVHEAKALRKRLSDDLDEAYQSAVSAIEVMRNRTMPHAQHDTNRIDDAGLYEMDMALHVAFRRLMIAARSAEVAMTVAHQDWMKS